MPWTLVAPEGTLHSIADEPALHVFCKAHSLRSNNVHHLLGLFDGNRKALRARVSACALSHILPHRSQGFYHQLSKSPI